MRSHAITVHSAEYRSALAWGAALLVGSIVGVALWSFVCDPASVWYLVPIIVIFGAPASAPFAAIGVWLAHRYKLERPLADIVGGALIALVTYLPVFVFGPPPQVTLAAGAVAGLAYWFAAGCPQRQR